jgi:hypothetical protein
MKSTFFFFSYGNYEFSQFWQLIGKEIGDPPIHFCAFAELGLNYLQGCCWRKREKV